MLPIEVLRTKAQQYVTEGLLQEDTAHRIIQVIEGERNAEILLNDGEDEETPLASKMSSRELQAELAKREALMKGDENVDPVIRIRDDRAVFLLRAFVGART